MKSASLSKITRPVLLGCLPRTRLFRQLDRARRRPIVWLEGPPGSGKTTLVSAYLQSRRIPCLWYQVDAGDGDAATFFYYLGLAGQAAAPRRRTPLPLLTPEFLPGLPLFTRRFFESLYDRLKPGAVIVFDNCQDAPPSSPFQEILLEGLSSLPEGIGAVLVSRTPPPQGFARFRAGNRMETIGWKELRLTAAETEGIVRRRWKRKRHKESLRYYQTRSDGWAAGLVLLLEGPAAAEAGSRRPTRQAPGEIFDYFAGEILAKLEEETRAFLLRSAFLPRMTAAMAEALTGHGRAAQLLSYLNRHNYFTEVRPHADPVYEYHSLFREFLLSRAEGALPAAEVRRLRRCAAEILEASGREEEAVRLLVEIGDARGLARVIRSAARNLVAQGRSQTLLEWLRSLPPDTVEADPWLLYWTGICRLPVQPDESSRCFEAAFTMFRKGKDAPGAFLSWSGMVDSLMYGHGGLKPLDRWFPLLDALLKEQGGFPSEEVEARATCSMVRAMALRRPAEPAMKAWADRALALARRSPDMTIRIESLVHLACYHYGGGDPQEIELILDTLRGLLKRPGIPLLARLTVKWVEAAHSNIMSAYGRCLRAVSDGLALADDSGVHVMDYMLAGQGALCCLKSGDLHAAGRYLRKMESSLALAKPWEASFYHFVEGWGALVRGDLAHARLHSERCRTLCEEVGNPWTRSLANLQCAQVRHGFGESERAQAYLAGARRIGAASGNEFIRFACLLTESYFALCRGDDGAALGALREGMRLGREKGFANLYMSRPGVLEEVVARALTAGIEAPYALDLVRKNKLVPGDAHLDLERWPWPLRVYTLGRFDVLKEEKPLRSSRKVQHKPLLMLKALIALGGRDVTDERLIDVLWPDTDGDLAHQSFSSTLRRLREMLGHEKAAQLREGRLTLERRHCWVDAWAFEGLLDRAEAGGGKDAPDAARLLEEAVGLYKGPFLPGEGRSSWIVPTRERLRSKFLRAVEELGRRLEAAGAWEKAVDCYRKGLDVDDLAEEIYRRLMTCQARLGRTAEALAAFHRCNRTLTALGAAPSPETMALLRSLRTS